MASGAVQSWVDNDGRAVFELDPCSVSASCRNISYVSGELVSESHWHMASGQTVRLTFSWSRQGSKSVFVLRWSVVNQLTPLSDRSTKSVPQIPHQAMSTKTSFGLGLGDGNVSMRTSW